MEHLKSKSKLFAEKNGAIYESVYKMGDTFKVKATIDIPKSLVNAFVSKAKKENDIDPRETWSDTDLAEMFVSYITATFMNVESLPVNALLGDNKKSSGEVQTVIEPAAAMAQTTPPAQVDMNQQRQMIPGDPSAEIQ